MTNLSTNIINLGMNVQMQSDRRTDKSEESVIMRCRVIPRQIHSGEKSFPSTSQSHFVVAKALEIQHPGWWNFRDI